MITFPFELPANVFVLHVVASRKALTRGWSVNHFAGNNFSMIVRYLFANISTTIFFVYVNNFLVLWQSIYRYVNYLITVQYISHGNLKQTNDYSALFSNRYNFYTNRDLVSSVLVANYTMQTEAIYIFSLLLKKYF